MKNLEIPSELGTAVSALAVALEERRQLQEIRSRSAEAARAATNAKSVAVRRLGELEADAELEAERQHGRADLQAALHGKSDVKTGQRNAGAAKLQKEIAALRGQIAEYDAAIAKAARLAAALPGKLVEADEAVVTANILLQTVLAPFIVSVEAQYRCEVEEAAASVVATLARWHAIGSALRLGHILQHVREIAIPAIRPGYPAVLFDGYAFKDGQRVSITEMAAPAVSDNLAALRNVLAELPGVTRAIASDRDQRRMEENAARIANAPRVTNATPGVSPALPPEPPARFTPTARDSYRSPGVPRDGDVMLDGHPGPAADTHPNAGIEQQ